MTILVILALIPLFAAILLVGHIHAKAQKAMWDMLLQPIGQPFITAQEAQKAATAQAEAYSRCIQSHQTS